MQLFTEEEIEQTLMVRCMGKPMAQEAFANLDELSEESMEIAIMALDSLMKELENDPDMNYKDEYVVEEIKKKMAVCNVSRDIEFELDGWMERHSVNAAYLLVEARSLCASKDWRGWRDWKDELPEEVRESARILAAQKMAEETPLIAQMWKSVYGKEDDPHDFLIGCVLNATFEYMCDKNVGYIMSTFGGPSSDWRIFSDEEVVKCITLKAHVWNEIAAVVDPDDEDHVLEDTNTVIANWLKNKLADQYDELRLREEDMERADIVALREDMERSSTGLV